MSFSQVWSAQTHLLKAHLIRVEVDLSKGLNAFLIVGLPDKAVGEAKDRLSAAIKNSGFKSPKQKNQKVIISLAPAHLKKEGAHFDLPMALGYLAATKALVFDPKKKLFLGELGLNGEVRGVSGVLPLVREAKREGFTEAYVPKENAAEAALVEGIRILAVANLRELIAHLINKPIEAGDETPFIAPKKLEAELQTKIQYRAPETLIDFADVKGQQSAKRGLEIAAAGGHNICLWGPPGTGKTMLAKAFTAILPPLDLEDAFEVTGIHSIAGALEETLLTHPPLRSPHHTASYIALVGGGSSPKPGEVTLAHRGVLFLDEFPEFERRVIDALRQPLEDRVVTISRIKGSAQFPAHFILIAAMNPCPCGNFGVKGKTCSCAPLSLERYKRKLSGPIVDRIDLWTEVSSVDYERLTEGRGEKSESASIREKVKTARETQSKRFASLKIKAKTNSELSGNDLALAVPLSDEVKEELNRMARKLDLSARSYHRIIKLARTIGDLEGSERVGMEHLHEAFQYRPKQIQG